MDSQLQAENLALRRQLDTLLNEARQNENKMRRFDRLQRELIGAESLPDLVGLLLSEYRQAFGVDYVTLALVDRNHELSRMLESDFDGELTLLRSAATLESLYGANRTPRLGPFDDPLHRLLFNTPDAPLASVALLPLVRHGELIGSLHFGSADANRYVANSGTDFLERLAEIIAVCLESALSQERLKLAGLTDALTGVQNRRYFEHRCQVEIAQAKRHKHALACMFLDVDRFKSINDNWGHQTGDEVLRCVSRAILSQLREGDTLARYGGEEFVALLPTTEMHHARQIAERIRAHVEQTECSAESGETLQVTISIGLSMLSSDEENNTAEHMIAEADRALYQAKHGGRNRVVCNSTDDATDEDVPQESLPSSGMNARDWLERALAASKRLLAHF